MDKEERFELEVREIQAGDLDALTELHRRVFADRFLSYMGRRFLRLYYAEFIGRELNRGCVALQGGKPVGFAVGTAELDGFYRRFFFRHPVSISLLAVWRFVVSRAARRDMVRSAAQFRYAFRSIFSRRGKPVAASELIGTGVQARLLAIGVAPGFRRNGVARELESRFLEGMRGAGAHTVGLGVDGDNTSAIAYYEKCGWQRDGRKAKVVYFCKSVSD